MKHRVFFGGCVKQAKRPNSRSITIAPFVSAVRSDIHENHRNTHVGKSIVLLNRCFPMYNLFLFLNKSVDKLWDLNN